MDWNSPTTKKHIKEAEAQGCKLLGAGKQPNYRLYELSCGHEEEAQTTNMRRGSFRCSVCQDEKLGQEAKAHGCSIRGKGRSHQYRVYELPCGHEQEVKTGHMRIGNFGCRVCREKKLRKEAKALGYELLGVGMRPPYRIYKLPCGHEQEIQPGNLSRGNVHCHLCFEERVKQEAHAQGCKIIGEGEKNNHRLYKLPCGHEQEVRVDGMRTGSFRCPVCLDDRFRQEAMAQGCEILGAGKNANYRLYKLSCGHEQEVRPGHMREGIFRCEVCYADQLRCEAEAQGCVLLGPGQRKKHRVYRMPCGHEQEVDIGNMRRGIFECKVCRAEKPNQEAKVQGCELLGAGKSRFHLLYRLPCGHEQEVRPGHMREGIFRCEVCYADQLNREAEAHGCVLLGPGQRTSYRVYRLPCGHEQEVYSVAMRVGGFRCQTCLTEKFRHDAEMHECELLGEGRSCHYRLYKLPCGHEQEVRAEHMRTGNFICHVCLDDRLNREAEAQGCNIRGKGRSSEHRVYELPCGHEQEVKTAAMREGGFRCRTCLAKKLNQEAEAQGCKLMGAGRNSNYRMYALPCGHQQEVGLGAMRKGIFLCQTCEETSRTLPSNVYLLHIKVGSDEWLKLGYAKSLDLRTSQYGLPNNAEVMTVKILHFDTGNEAHLAEAAIHSRNKRRRLLQKHMKLFHIKSGFDECYPVTMLDTLLAELEALKS